MHRLRRSATLVRLVLAWFVLALGVAVAAPAVQPRAMELVCSAGGGAKLVVVGEAADHDGPASHHSIECPLCLGVTPPPAPQRAQGGASPQVQVLQAMAAAPVAAAAGAPLPPRGPPVLS